MIKRFSEDIDISIDRAHLGFTGDADPMSAPSKKARGRCLEALQVACIKAVKEEILPALAGAIEKDLPSGWALEVDKEDALSLLFSFPSALGETDFTYITPYVKVEFGGRGDPWPQDEMTIRSYLCEVFPDQIHEEDVKLRVLGAERTDASGGEVMRARPAARSCSPKG